MVLWVKLTRCGFRSERLKQLFDRKKIELGDFDIKYKETINLIDLNAPVKIIANNKDDNEISNEFEIIDKIKQLLDCITVMQQKEIT